MIAAPLIYPLLGACMIVAQGYYKLTRRYISSVLEITTDGLATYVGGLAINISELVVLLSIKSQNSTFHTDLITLKSNSGTNANISAFLQKIKEHRQAVNENLKEARFHIGEQITIEWEGFLRKSNGSFGVIAGYSCKNTLISLRKSALYSKGKLNNIEQVQAGFQKALEKSSVNHPPKVQHFAIQL